MGFGHAVNWLFGAIFTTLISGAGFCSLCFALNYVKNYPRRRKEEMIKIQSEPHLNAPSPEPYDVILSPEHYSTRNGRSPVVLSRGASLFAAYRRSGAFLSCSAHAQKHLFPPRSLSDNERPHSNYTFPHNRAASFQPWSTSCARSPSSPINNDQLPTLLPVNAGETHPCYKNPNSTHAQTEETPSLDGNIKPRICTSKSDNLDILEQPNDSLAQGESPPSLKSKRSHVTTDPLQNRSEALVDWTPREDMVYKKRPGFHLEMWNRLARRYPFVLPFLETNFLGEVKKDILYHQSQWPICDTSEEITQTLPPPGRSDANVYSSQTSLQLEKSTNMRQKPHKLLKANRDLTLSQQHVDLSKTDQDVIRAPQGLKKSFEVNKDSDQPSKCTDSFEVNDKIVQQTSQEETKSFKLKKDIIFHNKQSQILSGDGAKILHETRIAQFQTFLQKKFGGKIRLQKNLSSPNYHPDGYSLTDTDFKNSITNTPTPSKKGNRLKEKSVNLTKKRNPSRKEHSTICKKMNQLKTEHPTLSKKSPKRTEKTTPSSAKLSVPKKELRVKRGSVLKDEKLNIKCLVSVEPPVETSKVDNVHDETCHSRNGDEEDEEFKKCVDNSSVENATASRISQEESGQERTECQVVGNTLVGHDNRGGDISTAVTSLDADSGTGNVRIKLSSCSINLTHDTILQLPDLIRLQERMLSKPHPGEEQIMEAGDCLKEMASNKNMTPDKLLDQNKDEGGFHLETTQEVRTVAESKEHDFNPPLKRDRKPVLKNKKYSNENESNMISHQTGSGMKRVSNCQRKPSVEITIRAGRPILQPNNALVGSDRTKNVLSEKEYGSTSQAASKRVFPLKKKTSGERIFQYEKKSTSEVAPQNNSTISSSKMNNVKSKSENKSVTNSKNHRFGENGALRTMRTGIFMSPSIRKAKEQGSSKPPISRKYECAPKKLSKHENLNIVNRNNPMASVKCPRLLTQYIPVITGDSEVEPAIPIRIEDEDTKQSSERDRPAAKPLLKKSLLDGIIKRMQSTPGKTPNTENPYCSASSGIKSASPSYHHTPLESSSPDKISSSGARLSAEILQRIEKLERKSRSPEKMKKHRKSSNSSKTSSPLIGTCQTSQGSPKMEKHEGDQRKYFSSKFSKKSSRASSCHSDSKTSPKIEGKDKIQELSKDVINDNSSPQKVTKIRKKTKPLVSGNKKLQKGDSSKALKRKKSNKRENSRRDDQGSPGPFGRKKSVSQNKVLSESKADHNLSLCAERPRLRAKDKNRLIPKNTNKKSSKPDPPSSTSYFDDTDSLIMNPPSQYSDDDIIKGNVTSLAMSLVSKMALDFSQLEQEFKA